MKWRTHGIVFVAAGVYLALGGIAGFVTVNAAVLLILSILRYREDRSRFAIVLAVVCALLLVVNQLALFTIIVLVSLAIYYFRAKPPGAGAGAGAGSGMYMNKHRLLLNMRLDEHSWMMRSMSQWHAVGEVRMDMSLAVPEEKDTTIVLQGLVGDVVLTVPEEYGLQVDASVMLGQVSLRDETEGGVLHRVSWRSPDYDNRESKLKLQLFYLVGDIKIRTV